MKILYVLGTFPKISSEAFILNEMVELVKLHHDVHIIADRRELDRAHKEAFEYGLIDRTIAPGRDYRRGLDKLIDFTGKSSMGILRQPVDTLKLLSKICRYIKDPWVIMDIYLSLINIKDLDVDLIHSPFSNSKNLLRAYLISSSKKVPFTNTMRAREIYHSVESKELDNLSEILKKSGSIMTISDFNKNYIENRFGIKNVSVIRSAINTEKFKPLHDPKKKKKKRITTICRFIEKKGIEYLIEAISIIHGYGNNDFEFLLIGDGPLKEKYEVLIEEKGLSERSSIESRLTQEEIVQELSDTMIFCLPSIIAHDNDMDMLPNSIKEAMAMEIPVLTTKMPGIEELIENEINGILVEQRNSGEIARALIRLMEDPELRSYLGKNGRNTIIRRFSAEKEVVKLERIFRSVTNDRCKANSDR